MAISRSVVFNVPPHSRVSVPKIHAQLVEPILVVPPATSDTDEHPRMINVPQLGEPLAIKIEGTQVKLVLLSTMKVAVEPEVEPTPIPPPLVSKTQVVPEETVVVPP